MTKRLNDELTKPHLTIDDPKIEVCTKIIERSLMISETQIIREPKRKIKVRAARNKMPVKKTSRLERATRILYDLEDGHDPEKTLNIDFGLYQMEDY